MPRGTGASEWPTSASRHPKRGFGIREAVVVDIGSGFAMDDYVVAKAL